MADKVNNTKNSDFISLHYGNKDILIFKDIDQIADYAIEKWTEISKKAIKKRGCFTAALSGGKTPVNLYQQLSDKKMLPWDKTHLFIVDERFVPYEHEESNYRMVDHTLLSHVKIPKENIHRISTEGVTPNDSAARYEDELISFFKTANTKLPQFDLILLGIGEDGHTASLFPGTRSLNETRYLAVAASISEKAKKERITLTFPVINNARNIIILALGDNKTKTIKEVIEEENCLLPAAMVNPRKGKLFFLLDESAGSLLNKNR